MEEVNMAYYYFDDGSPESEENMNNYIFFNAQNPDCVQKMLKLAETMALLPQEGRRALFEKISQSAQH